MRCIKLEEFVSRKGAKKRHPFDPLRILASTIELIRMFVTIKKFDKALFTKLFCCIGDENYPSLLEGLFFCCPKHAKQFRAAEKVPHMRQKQGHGQAAVERNSITSETCKKEAFFIVLLDETGSRPLQTLRETSSLNLSTLPFGGLCG